MRFMDGEITHAITKKVLALRVICRQRVNEDTRVQTGLIIPIAWYEMRLVVAVGHQIRVCVFGIMDDAVFHTSGSVWVSTS